MSPRKKAREKGAPRAAAVTAAPRASEGSGGPMAALVPNQIASTDLPADALAALARERGGGQRNIRGIVYQLLYAAWRALDLMALPAGCRLRFEGIEDVDVEGLVLRPLVVGATAAHSPLELI